MTNDIEKLARLSKLEFDDSEKNQLYESLNVIKEFAKSFDELDFTQDYIFSHTSSNANVQRQDLAQSLFDRDTLLSNTPLVQEGFICVPKVIEQETT